MRAAFQSMVVDEKFRAETLKSGLELDPLSGEELDQITSRILQTPKEIVQLAADLVK
ncbi:MAG TPA: hypothetical protein VH684_22000 [Xanthobacteraceae bacterium]